MTSLFRQIAVVSGVFLLAAASPSESGSSARVDDPFSGLPSKVAAQLKKNLPGVVIESKKDVPPLQKADEWLPLSQADFEFERVGSRNKSGCPSSMGDLAWARPACVAVPLTWPLGSNASGKWHDLKGLFRLRPFWARPPERLLPWTLWAWT